MNRLINFLKKLKFYLESRKLPGIRYDVSANSKFIPYGPKMSFRTNFDDRVYLAVGKNCIIDAEFIFERSSGFVKIGDNVHLGGVKFISISGITIGNDVTMAWGITLYDHNSHSIDWQHRFHDNDQCYNDFLSSGNNIINKDWSNVKTKEIVIKDKVWIGFDVVILKGVTIGEGAVIAARSVITKDVPDWSVVAGNPARVVKNLQ
jgi:acetyltransferase-like isoleucine patch superfamily enzyme